MKRTCYACSLLAAAALSSCSREAHPVEARSMPAVGSALTVAVAPATRRSLSRELSLAAEFRPYQEVEVHAKVAGYLKKIYVDVGDYVTAGQLLATLEIPEMEQDLSQAAAAKKRSEAELLRNREELRRAESAHEATHLAYQRLAAVLKSRPNLVAQQEIDDALARDRVSEAQVSAAKASLSAAEEGVTVSGVGVSKARTMQDYTRVTAPFAGLITKRYADTGSMIQAGTASQTQAMPVVRVSQVDRLRLILPVPESVVARVQVGRNVEVRVPALNQTILGRVARFAGRVNTTTRTMETEVDVPNPGRKLTPGMYAEALLTLDRSDEGVTVPVQSLAVQGGSATVMIVTPEQKIEERTVKVGLETADYVQVASGLREGELVVVGNRSQLKPGQSVQPKVTAAAVKGE